MYLDFAGSPHGGVLKLLPEADQQTRIKAVGLVHHTIVGSAAGAYYFFRDSTGTESTFILPKTGIIWELMALDRVSDAQVAGNYWEAGGVGYGFLSVETEDNGDPEHDPWTQPQLDSLRWLNDKLARVFGWARRQTVAPSGSTAAGTGYHSMWGINTATTHPNPWTLANGKTCPATPRIGQYKATLLPAYVSGTISPGGLHMDADVKAAFDAIPQRVAERLGPLGTDVKTIISRVGTLQAALTAGIADDAERDARVLGRLDSLSLPSFTAEQVAELAAALDLDEDAVADAVRRDLAEALAGPQ